MRRGRGIEGIARAVAVDRLLLASALGLLFLGVLMVFSASAAVSVEQFGTPFHYLFRQLVYASAGVGLLFAASTLDYRRLDRPVVVWAAVAGTLVLLALALQSSPINGVNRWVRLGPLSFQPSEAAKLSLVLFLAWLLQRREGRTNDFSATLLPALLVLGQMVLLVALEPDLGAAGMLMLVFVGVFFVAGVSWSYLTGCSGVFLLLLVLYATSADYRLSRLAAFMDPGADPLGAGFQVRQSLIAVGTGGFTGVSHAGPLGTGLGESVQKLFFLPYPHTDFIFGVIGEELGLLGTLTVVALYTVLLWRGVVIALRAGDRFGALLAVGITLALAAQAYLNIAVVLGLVPTKGFPLPLVSYGGSSLLCSCLGLGVLLSISADAGGKG